MNSVTPVKPGKIVDRFPDLVYVTPMKLDSAKIPWKGWQNCWRIGSGALELIVTADVGPRIISFSRSGGKNVFKAYQEMLGHAGGTQWKIYGGHRLWYAPENAVTTYQPDNERVDCASHGEKIHFTQKPEPLTGIVKSLSISMVDNDSVAVAHTITNEGKDTIELAPWALTVMAEGGIAILPLPEPGSHPEKLLPEGRLVLWPYTNLSDPRYSFIDGYVLVKQDPKVAAPQKIGLYAQDTKRRWLAYLNESDLFVKTPVVDGEGEFPDLGVHSEIWTNHEMLELETLAPMRSLKPGERTVHTEKWMLRSVKSGTIDAEWIRNNVEV